MKLTKIAILLTMLALAGCATSYRLVVPGVNTIGKLQVTAGDSWNSAPASATPASRSQSRTWTQDGLLLDRLMLISGVSAGESIFKSPDQSAALPSFKADMLPNEIEELVESSIVKLFGEGNAVVSTENLRPQLFGDHSGFMFDIETTVTESPDYRGMVGGFIAEDRLYLMIFLAEQPEYFEKHREEVDALIKSATTTRPTIGFH